MPEQETNIGESSFGIGTYFVVWVLTAAVMTVAGVAAWGMARTLVRAGA